MGVRRVVFLLGRGAFTTLTQRRRVPLILGTVGVEALAAAAVKRQGQRVFLYDYLPPRSRRYDFLLSLALHRIDGIFVVRSGDIDILQRRFRLHRSKVQFVPFPVTAVPEGRSIDDGYIYSAGASQRDYATLCAAVARRDLPTVISTDAGRLPQPPACVTVHGPLSPERGRELMRRCAVVAVAFHESDVPAGPLIVLDAMALGKPVVATDVIGTRDYVEHEVTGLLVPPRDPAAMAEALERLADDPQLRRRLGEAARDRALTLTVGLVAAELSEAVGTCIHGSQLQEVR